MCMRYSFRDIDNFCHVRSIEFNCRFCNSFENIFLAEYTFQYNKQSVHSGSFQNVFYLLIENHKLFAVL